MTTESANACAKPVGRGRVHALDPDVRDKLQENEPLDAADARAIAARIATSDAKGGGLQIVRTVMDAFGKESVDLVYRSKTSGVLGAFRVFPTTCVCLGCGTTSLHSLLKMEAHVKDGKPTRKEVERFAFRTASKTYVSVAEVAEAWRDRKGGAPPEDEDEDEEKTAASVRPPPPQPPQPPPRAAEEKQTQTESEPEPEPEVRDASEEAADLLDACARHAALMHRLGRPDYGLDVLEAARDVVRKEPGDAPLVVDMLRRSLRPFDDPRVLDAAHTVLEEAGKGAACRAVASGALAKAPRDVLRAVAAARPPMRRAEKADVMRAAADVARRAAELFRDHAEAGAGAGAGAGEKKRKREDDEAELVRALAKAVRDAAAALRADHRDDDAARKRTVEALVRVVRAAEAGTSCTGSDGRKKKRSA